jgi:bZIP transcription factor
MSSESIVDTKLSGEQNQVSLASSSDSEGDDRETTSVAGSAVGVLGGKQRISSSRKRVIDETLLSPEDADKLETRRAYNRECATRARKRTKNLVSQLQDEVKTLQTDKEELRRENAVLKAQLEGFEKQNQTLMFKNVLVDQRHMHGAMGAGAYLQPHHGVTLGDALSEMRMASLAGRESAASRARLMFPTATQNLLSARFPGGMP